MRGSTVNTKEIKNINSNTINLKPKTQVPFVALVYAAFSFLRVVEALNAGKKRPICENFGCLLRNRTGDLLLEGIWGVFSVFLFASSIIWILNISGNVLILGNIFIGKVLILDKINPPPPHAGNSRS